MYTIAVKLKQILQEKITTNEKHMIDLIETIENVVSKVDKK